MVYRCLPNLKMGGSFHGELLVITRGYPRRIWRLSGNWSRRTRGIESNTHGDLMVTKPTKKSDSMRFNDWAHAIEASNSFVISMVLSAQTTWFFGANFLVPKVPWWTVRPPWRHSQNVAMELFTIWLGDFRRNSIMIYWWLIMVNDG